MMSLIQRIRCVAPLAGLWLTAPAFAASDCALAPERQGVLLEYSGECRDGRVYGVADVMIELPPAADGRTRRAREFGWFQRGVPQGAHVAVLSDPEGKSPGFAMLISFNATGQTNWSFGQSAANWPTSGTLLSGGPWEDVDGKAREAGIDYPTAKRADGTAFSEGMTTIADVINQAVEFSMVSGVQSVNPATLRHFLTSVSVIQPLAGVSTGFPTATILPETDEAAQDTRTAAGVRGTDAILQPGEIIARTREGCGLITQVPDEKYRQTIIDSTLRKSWLGECVDGMVLGPGTLLVRTNEDRISLIQRQWYFNGRPIGESTVTTFSSGSYQGGTIDAFSWANTSFSRNQSAAGAPVAQPLGSNPPMAMESSPQRKVIYTLLRSENGWPAECGPDGSACLQERVLGSIPSVLNYYRCKKNDCTALWAEKVAPILAAYEAFKTSHAADVEAAQQSVEPILAPLLTTQKKTSRDTEVAGIIRDAQGAHTAERTKAAAEAEQARIAEEKAKAAESAAKAESRKKFWGNVLSGTTALIGAAATYAEARERLERPAMTSAPASARPAPAVPPAVTTTSSNPYGNNSASTPSSYPDTGSGVSAPPSATSASTGNRRSGFTYDDTNHSQCLSIRTTGQNRGSRMAYGHYQLINHCGYPIMAQICTVSDNADGSPSDSWNKFQDGAPCPGGWGGAAFKAGEVQDSKTWFEFRNIRFHAYICREGWSIVNMQDKSVYLIGERYRCRIYR